MSTVVVGGGERAEVVVFIVLKWIGWTKQAIRDEKCIRTSTGL